MTSTKRSSEGKSYSSLPYFRFNIRQNWQQLVLFLILTLFIMLLPSYIQIQDTLDWIDRGGNSPIDYISLSEIADRTQDNMLMISAIGLFVSGGLAVISGMTAMSYVNSKKNVGCYHSFPIKRESMFVIETVTPAIYYTISIVAGYALSYLMFLCTLHGAAEFAGEFFKIMLIGIVVYLFIYSTFLLAGGLTGTGVMKFIMVLIIYFLPIAVYLITVSLLSNFSSIYDSYYLSVKPLSYLSPIIYVIYGVVSYFETGKMVWAYTIVLSIVFYCGALVLSKFRKSESSGTTVIWKPIFVLVKYAMIFAAGLLGAWVFYYIGDENPISVFFGLIFGGVVALVLMNCIMYRSTKAMFKDFKKFLICIACTLAFVVIVPFNITGMIGRPYTDSLTKSITIKTDRGTYVTFDEKEDVKLLMEIFDEREYERMRRAPYIYSEDREQMQKIIDKLSEYVISGNYYKGEGYYEANGNYYDEYGNRVPDNDIDAVEFCIEQTKDYAKEYVSWESSNVIVTVIQKPYFGIPLARTVSVDVNGPLWDSILESDEYAKSYNIPEIYKDATLMEVDFSILGYDGYFHIAGTIENDPLAKQLIEACKHNAENREQSLVVGYAHMIFVLPEVSLTGTTRTNIYYPVYASDVEFINLIGKLVIDNNNSPYEGKYGEPNSYGKLFTGFKTEDDVITHLADAINCAALVNVDTLEAALIEDRAVIKDLLADVSNVIDRDWTISQFMKSVDTDYILIINYGADYKVQVRTHFRPDTVTNGELKATFDSLK